jgi:RND family efflux transporter MFP subunit
MRKYRLLFILTSVAIVYSCSGNKKAEIQNGAVIPVEVVEATSVGEGGFVSASGKTEAVNSANLSTRIMGNVRSVEVRAGQKVAEGELLVSIQSADLAAQRARAETSVSQASAANTIAKKDYERFSKLFEQQSATQKELDDLSARYEIAKANLEGAKQMLNEVKAQFAYADIRAPFSGVVTNTFVKEGDMANPGAPLVSMEGLTGFQVTAMIPESDISEIKSGMPVKILIKSIGKEVSGKVTELSQSSKNTGGQYLVKVSPDKNEAGVLSGMFVNVTFPLSPASAGNSSPDRILIDESALVKQGQLSGIYAVGPGNTAILRWLRLGKKSGNRIEVLSGLTAGEKYILSAEGKLYNGARVSYK